MLPSFSDNGDKISKQSVVKLNSKLNNPYMGSGWIIGVGYIDDSSTASGTSDHGERLAGALAGLYDF